LKKAILPVIVLLVSLSLLTSCTPSVPKTDYDKALADLAASQVQTQSVQTELTAAKTQTQSVQAELTTAKTQNQSLQSEIQSAKEKAKQAKLRMEILNAFFLPQFKGQQLTPAQQADLFFTMRDNVKATGDATLNAKFQALMDTAVVHAQTPTATSLQTVTQATADFFAYLLENMPKTLN
jgi:septal ring factor EnvC (AmiA/AmiB activator)